MRILGVWLEVEEDGRRSMVPSTVEAVKQLDKLPCYVAEPEHRTTRGAGTGK